jgi:3-methyladenine DNA glycosylase AlkD
MNYQDFSLKLTRLIDDDYREFAIKGILTKYPFLGVRTPDLRVLSSEIIKNNFAIEFLKLSPKSYEELTIQGFLIASLPYEKMKKLLPKYLKKVDNWATTDMVVSSLKSIKKHREDFLGLIDEFLDSSHEFTVRTALVCLKSYYITPDYLAVIFDRTAKVKDREEYYIKMAVAWLIAECFIKFPDETWGFLKSGVLPTWTQNKAISKIRDSFRVPSEAKTALLSLKK